MRDWVFRNGLIDLGYFGADYTWSNASVKERLDRTFCCDRWRLLFPEALIFHLARLSSDHCPILLKTVPNDFRCRERAPFIFHAMWMMHNNFHEMLRANWQLCEGDLLCKSEFLAKALKCWNRDVFGNIFAQKRRLLARISGIQRSLGRGPNPFLRDLEKKLSEEYATIRDAEALFWRQKSRDKWLQEGDRNTRFFHLSTVIRRRRNKIVGLLDSEGQLCSNLEKMQEIAVNYFKSIFSKQQVSRTENSFALPPMFPDLSEEDLMCLGNVVKPLEIHHALFQIGKFKAPGVDGFPALFFQDNWDTCGQDVIKTVTKAFHDRAVPEGLNHTLIVLVPKVPSPQSMQLFRPISLCCTIYKVISKVIVARLRPFLKSWISPNQVSFVPGRHISDNIMIAQELLHKFKCASGKKGFMAWKIDLSKAYDKLSWEFISQVLTEIKIPDQLASLIMHCVTSTSFQVLVNGEMSASFKGCSGIRQGDPLSPYLFVLCMEKLSHMINHAVAAGIWRAVKSTRFGPHISHLFFADDLILFAEASADQARVMKKVMDILCSVSGQSVNFDKSLIYCAANVKMELAKSISNICGSPLTADMGNYLGMPLIHSRVGKNTYSYLVDKIHSRLASWKSKCLNMAGRLTLLQSVNAAVPIYAMQTSRIPISTCDRLDKLNRDFLWGDCAERRKVHAVKWSTVCRPKDLGGLGIKRTRDMNLAMLAKASWRLIQKDEGLWSQVYSRKYLCNASLTQNYQKPAGCSSTWASVIQGSKLLIQGLRWRIGNGATVKFWTDHWTEFGKLCEFVEDHDEINLSQLVKDFWRNKEWDIDKLSRFLPPEFVEAICAIPISVSDMEDRVIWGATSDGKFSVKSAYRLNFSENSSSCYPWLKNWFLRIPPKLKIFLWTAVDGKLMTNQQRWIRHFSPVADCPFCPGIMETLTHLLRDCPRAVLVWKSLSIPVKMAHSFRMDCRGWFFANLLQGNCLLGEVPWNVLFSFCCWHLWKWRCKAVFDSSFCFPYNVQLVIWNCVMEWWKASAVKRKISPKHEELLHWIKPPAGVFKINVDGSRSLGGCIGAGGAIRDCLGTWHGGFMVNLGVGEVLLAEAWGLFHGLLLALRCGADHIEVESDSASLVKLVQDRMVEVHPLGTLISNCNELMKKFNRCSLIHIFRERNRVADLLAKASLNMELGECFLEEVPAVAAEAMLDDINGVAKARVVPTQASFHDQCSDANTSCRQFSYAGASGVGSQVDSCGGQNGEEVCEGEGSGEAVHDGYCCSEPGGVCYPADVQIPDAGESHFSVYGQAVMVTVAEEASLPRQLTPGVHGLDAVMQPHWLRQEGLVDNVTMQPRQKGDVIAARLHNQCADGLCSLHASSAQFGTECVADVCGANKGEANVEVLCAQFASSADPVRGGQAGAGQGAGLVRQDGLVQAASLFCEHEDELHTSCCKQAVDDVAMLRRKVDFMAVQSGQSDVAAAALRCKKTDAKDEMS